MFLRSAFALLRREQLGRGLVDQQGACHGQQGLREHIAGVVAQAVSPGGQALVQVEIGRASCRERV